MAIIVQVDTPAGTVNERLLDASVRHQIFLQRYGGSTARDIIKLLEEAERDVVRLLEERFARLGTLDRQRVGAGLMTSVRLRSLLRAIRQQTRDLRVALGDQLEEELKELVETEIDIAGRRIEEATAVGVQALRPSPELLRAIVTGGAIRGQTMRQWFKKLTDDRFRNVEAAVRLGMVEGDTMQQMVRRVRQAENISKVRATALVRTGVNAVANQSRELLYEANRDVIKAVRWTATLDARTSDICRARDGMTWPIGSDHPRPPAHPNCRSVLVPVTRSWEEMARPGSLKRKRGATDVQKIFEEQLMKKGFNRQQRAEIIANRKISMDGGVPRGLTYSEWLPRQSARFQDQVLGPTRGKLFRQGGVTLDRFVDLQTGRRFTLNELREREAAAFMSAGL